METLVQQIINGLVLGSMYALVALGYTMVYGVLNLINFAHGDVLMIGAMVGVTILNIVQQLAPDLPGIVKLGIAILGAIPVCMLVSITIERIAYRRLRNAPRLAPLITAIGVSILLQTIAMLIWGRSPVPVPQVMPAESWHLLGARITPTQVTLLVLAAVSMAALVFMIEKTRIGRAMRATSENPRIAGLMGVDANRVVVLTFAIGAALAAVAGVMWGALYSSAQFAMGFMPGLKAFSAAVLGGIGNIYGAVLGGLLLGLIESLGAGYVGDWTGNFFGSQYQDIFAFLVLVIVLTLRPSGLVGERVADRA
ncbi:MAG: branched-chain amino acid transporter permease [Paucimonas sp.]|jgi:branched-chain amino acid transport system permease protein|nr:branched-chain amino acid transporter permease [Paucimonas sp.]